MEDSTRAEFANDLTNDLVTSLTMDEDLLDTSFVYSLSTENVQTTVTDVNGTETSLDGTSVVVNANGSYSVTNPAFESIDSSSDISVNFNYVVTDQNGATSDSKTVTLEIDKEDTYTALNDENIDMSSLLSTVIANEADIIDLSQGDHILNDFTLDEFIALTDDDNTLKILGDSTDKVQLKTEQGWSTNNEVDSEGFVTYTTPSDQSLKLLIEDTVTVENI